MSVDQPSKAPAANLRRFADQVRPGLHAAVAGTDIDPALLAAVARVAQSDDGARVLAHLSGAFRARTYLPGQADPALAVWESAQAACAERIEDLVRRALDGAD